MAGSGSRALGQAGEKLALRYLRARGLQCITQNFYSRFGEIDLVMQDAECIVFVEVRQRSSSSFAHAAATVTKHKQAKLWSTALFYLAKHPQVAQAPCRFDVVAIDDEQQIVWHQDAFRCD